MILCAYCFLIVVIIFFSLCSFILFFSYSFRFSLQLSLLILLRFLLIPVILSSLSHSVLSSFQFFQSKFHSSHSLFNVPFIPFSPHFSHQSLPSFINPLLRLSFQYAFIPVLFSFHISSFSFVTLSISLSTLISSSSPSLLYLISFCPYSYLTSHLFLSPFSLPHPLLPFCTSSHLLIPLHSHLLLILSSALQCSDVCGNGTHSREVVCVVFLRGTFRATLDIECDPTARPEDSQSCNPEPCPPHWYYTDWSQVCVGGGVSWGLA